MKVLKFAADWCGPCKQMTEWLKSHEHNHTITEINIEGNKEMVEHYGIRGVPTLIMLNEDDTVNRTVVGFSIPKLTEFLKASSEDSVAGS